MYIGSGVCEDRQIDRPPEELSNRFKLTSQAFFPFVCRLLPGEAIPAACLRARALRDIQGWRVTECQIISLPSKKYGGNRYIPSRIHTI